jgi:hypothetical protein
MSSAGAALARALRDPGSTLHLDGEQWTQLITAARSESLLASLAHRLAAQPIPQAVRVLLQSASEDAEKGRRQALWEAEMARRALSPLPVPVVLLKGTAYAAAGLCAGEGRSIGDLDILVPRDSIAAVEAALLAAGWQWVKPDEYDDLYYRRWMHELPPLIHGKRDRMIDVHHTILPLTARRRPDADALIASSVALPSGLRILAPADMIVHAAAHAFADGDLAGGLRNLWDIDRLVREFAPVAGFWERLAERAARHEMHEPVARGLRLAASLYATPVEERWFARPRRSDALFRQRLLVRDGWGRERRPLLRLAFYIRSHLLRMPPLMLARHLWIKARRGRPGS